jgi:hypothetical protein
MYQQHNYRSNHIWNLNEIGIQAGWLGLGVLAKRRSHIIYNTIPKSCKWLTMNCVVNVARTILPRFYIFRVKRMCDDYIKQCKFETCMAMQAKEWMTTFLFKEILSFFKRLILGGISQTNRHSLILHIQWSWVTCHIKSHRTNNGFWVRHDSLAFTHLTCFLAFRFF